MQSTAETLLNPIRENLLALVRQAGGSSAHIEFLDGGGTLRVDAAGNVSLEGWAEAAYPEGATVATLRLADLAALAEAAAHELTLSPQQRTEKAWRRRAEELYFTRKLASNLFVFSHKLTGPDYTIWAGGGFTGCDTDVWVKDVSLERKGARGTLEATVTLRFAQDSADVLEAKLELVSGEVLGTFSSSE